VTLEIKEDDSMDGFVNKYHVTCDGATTTSNTLDEAIKVDIMLGTLPTL
jgi:hypothetical protein